MPPSHVCRFDARSGALLEPFSVVVGIVGPPLSFRKMTSVSSSSRLSWSAANVRPIASSITESIAAYVRRRGSAMVGKRARYF